MIGALASATAAELGLLAAAVYMMLTAASYSHPDIPFRYTAFFFASAVVLFLISGHPHVTLVLDRSRAKTVGFIGWICIGIVAWWVAANSDHVGCPEADHSPTEPDSDTDDEDGYHE